MSRRLYFFAAVSALLAAPRLAAQHRYTLDDVLRAARAANAHLPVAALNVSIARQQLREAEARRKPRVFLDGDVHDGAPPAYTSGDARLQVIGADTLFDGGRLRATQTSAEHMLRAAISGYRVTEKDIDLDVRLRFADALDAQRTIDIRRTSLDRLRAYLTLIEAMRAGGQGVANDVLRTRARVAAEEANVADAERLFDDAQVDLNDLMGRPPREPLPLADLPSPTPVRSSSDAPWRSVPDIAQADAITAAARAGVTVARADRRPQISITADVGYLPTLGNSNAGTGLNTGTGAGGELTLWFTWPIWDAGVFKARLAEAQLAAEQAADSALVVRRQAQLEWSRAIEQLDDLYQIVQLRASSVPLARDAYLQAESMYRGGVGTALDVLDAYSAWVDAQIAEVDATRDYRQAEARFIRWGTP
ncbi:MAG TPA: TolC family protein [Gemmatimonadaceae bacterium]|nr:TolC family protein [Gemmatimonadaceae bacterium]